jgi:hypothetical protein
MESHNTLPPEMQKLTAAAGASPLNRHGLGKLAVPDGRRSMPPKRGGN